MSVNSVNLNAKVKHNREPAVIHKDNTDRIHQSLNCVSIYWVVAGIQIAADNKKMAARIEKVCFPRKDDSSAPSEKVMV